MSEGQPDNTTFDSSNWWNDSSPLHSHDLGGVTIDNNTIPTSPLDIDLLSGWDDFQPLPPSPPASSSPHKKTQDINEVMRKDAADRAKAKKERGAPRPPETLATLRLREVDLSGPSGLAGGEVSQPPAASATRKRKKERKDGGSNTKRSKTKNSDDAVDSRQQDEAASAEELSNAMDEIPSCSEALRVMRRIRHEAEMALNGALVQVWAMSICAERLQAAKHQQTLAAEREFPGVAPGGLDVGSWLVQARAISQGVQDGIKMIKAAKEALAVAVEKERGVVSELYVERLEMLQKAENQEQAAQQERDAGLAHDLEMLRTKEQQRKAERKRLIEREAKRVGEVEQRRGGRNRAQETAFGDDVEAESRRQISDWQDNRIAGQL